MTTNYFSRRILSGACAALLWPACTWAEEKESLPPIKHLADVSPKRSVFEAAKGKDPLTIKSADEAAKHFDDDAIAKLSKEVDFTKQVVLIFAWKGSGQDELDFKVLESFPEQIVFELLPGRTKDLRSHTRVYALRSNVKWEAGWLRVQLRYRGRLGQPIRA